MDQQTDSRRIGLVDALRGFALLAIVLLHNLEHYNIFGSPADPPAWISALDRGVFDTIFFFLAGKAYATFSLLFGLSFFIQMRNARRRGCDYRMRFAWRMLILVGFSQLHALFYNGDILLLYAVCGLILIPASSWRNRTVAIVATVLMIQPWAWGKIIYAALNPGYIDTNNGFAVFAASAEEAGRTGTFLQTLVNNIWNGQLYSNFWQVEAGRLFQTPALFLFGMLLGRLNMFERNDLNTRRWRKALLWGLISAVPLYCLSRFVPPLIANVTILSYYCIAIPMLYNFAFMVVLVSAFVLLWFARSGRGAKWQTLLVPYGRMSLTNYITQSIIGVTIYYHYGLNLYDKVGSAGSALIAVAIVAAQLIFSRHWLSTHRQGPLEHIWKRFTWLNAGKKQESNGLFARVGENV